MSDQLVADIAETTRQLQRKAPEPPIEEPKPQPEKSNDISGAGLVFFEQVKALQADRDRLANELNAANARIEQFQSTVTDLKSRIETANLSLEDARNTIDYERSERIRLAAVIEHSITSLRGALSQPDAE